jgi:hypothetical protein
VRQRISSFSVRGSRTPAAGLEPMWPAVTALLSAALRRPCLLAIVLPDEPSVRMDSSQRAMSSRDSSASGMVPITGSMLFFSTPRYSCVVLRSTPERWLMWWSTHLDTVMDRTVWVIPLSSRARAGPTALTSSQNTLASGSLSSDLDDSAPLMR